MESKLLTEERFVDKNTGFTYRYVHSETEYFRPHYHDYYELFLMLDGAAIHMVNGAELPLKRGSLVFIRPFRRYLRLWPPSPLRKLAQPLQCHM